jgi:exodeoxyribonuclease V beta subunit
MTRGAHAALSRHASVGRDVDDLATAIDLDATANAEAAAPRLATPVVLAEFPRGAAPGELLHSVFEHTLGEKDEAKRAAVAERELKRHGFDERHLSSLQQAMEDVLATPLATDADSPEGAAAWTLGALLPTAFVAEMEFVLPVAAKAEGRLLTAAQLAVPLADEGPVQSGSRSRAAVGAPWDARYAEQVARLDFQAWSGFLRGFIDLVFEHDGKFFVLDYKSNHLGAHAEDYRPERLNEAMAEHHYYLQYLLYSVALHRHLAQRIAKYDYDVHFGGVYYLFVRGMQPRTGAGYGVFFHRPSRRLIERLSALLDDPLAESGDAVRPMEVATR